MDGTDELEARKKRVIDRLTERFSRDDLPMDEYERLVAEVNRVSTPRELAVAEDIAGTAAEASSFGTTAAGGFLDEESVQSCSVILSERRHRGNWLRKPNVAAVTVLASQVFDFTETELPAGRTTLEVVAVLGSVEVIVPSDVSVRLEVVPIAGEASLGRGVSAVERAGSPVLVVTGNAILGSVVVKRG